VFVVVLFPDPWNFFASEVYLLCEMQRKKVEQKRGRRRRGSRVVVVARRGMVRTQKRLLQ
jgi:hypothetical protein